MARNRRPISARAERRAGELLRVLCSTGNTREAFSVEAWNKPGRECTVAGACATPNRRVG